MSETAICITRRKNKKTSLSRLPTILLLGLPGSGKRTLGNRLRQLKDYSFINVGQILRERRLSGGRKEKDPTFSCPELAAEGIVLSIIEEQMISRSTKCREYLLQGFPCDIEQFVWFEKKLSGKVHAAIFLDIPVQSAIERTARRKLCGARWDDGISVVLERIKVFQQSTEPLVEHLASAGKLIRISGLCDPKQIRDFAMEELTKRLQGEARLDLSQS